MRTLLLCLLQRCICTGARATCVVQCHPVLRSVRVCTRNRLLGPHPAPAAEPAVSLLQVSVFEWWRWKWMSWWWLRLGVEALNGIASGVSAGVYTYDTYSKVTHVRLGGGGIDGSSLDHMREGDSGMGAPICLPGGPPTCPVCTDLPLMALARRGR